MRFRQKLAVFMILLIILIPFYTSSVFAEENGILPTITGDVEDAGEQCIAKHQKTTDLVDVLDNKVIAKLEEIFSLMFLICTVTSVIDIILSALSTISTIGTFDGGCCNPEMEICPTGPCGAPCGAMTGIYKAWSGFYKSPAVEALCCFVNCGWCTGKGCGGIMANIPGIGANKVNGDDKLFGKVHISPYENIYTAFYCRCPLAVIFNIRKLKTIYQVYNCCVEQSCRYGTISTEVCEKQLSEATCMYWEGSILKTLIKNLAILLIQKISGKVAEMVGQKFLNSCTLALLELANIPRLKDSVLSALEWRERAFDEPNCEELGFGDISHSIKQMEQDPYYYLTTNEENPEYNMNYIDSDGDGIYEIAAKDIITPADGPVPLDQAYDKGYFSEMFNSDSFDDKMSQGIYFTKEYNPNQKTIVFIHGVVGSPKECSEIASQYGDDYNIAYYAYHSDQRIAGDNGNGNVFSQDYQNMRDTFGISNEDVTIVPHSVADVIVRDAVVNHNEEGTFNGVDVVSISGTYGGSSRAEGVGEGLDYPFDVLGADLFFGKVSQDQNPDSDYQNSLYGSAGTTKYEDTIGNHIMLANKDDPHKVDTDNYKIATQEADKRDDVVFIQKDIGNEDNRHTALLQDEATLSHIGSDDSQSSQATKDGYDRTAQNREQIQRNYNQKQLRELEAQQIAQQAAYKALWMLAEYALDEYAYPAVDDICKEDWEASQSSNSQPIATGSNNFDPTTSPEQENECNGISNTIMTAQILSKAASGDQYVYEITYTITSCKQDISYSIELSNGGDAQSIGSGYLDIKETAADTREIQSQYDLDKICIEVSDPAVGEVCFPPG